MSAGINEDFDTLLMAVVSASLILDNYIENTPDAAREVRVVSEGLASIRDNLSEDQVARVAFLMANLEDATQGS